MNVFYYFMAEKTLMAVACLKISHDNEKNIKKYDGVVISTDHSSYDYDFMLNTAGL